MVSSPICQITAMMEQAIGATVDHSARVYRNSRTEVITIVISANRKIAVTPSSRSPTILAKPTMCILTLSSWKRSRTRVSSSCENAW